MVFWILVAAWVLLVLWAIFIKAEGFAIAMSTFFGMLFLLLSMAVLSGIAAQTGEWRAVVVEQGVISPLTNRAGIEGYVLMGTSDGDTTANYRMAGGADIERYRTFDMEDVKITEVKGATTGSAKVTESEIFNPWLVPWAAMDKRLVELTIPVGGIGTL